MTHHIAAGPVRRSALTAASLAGAVVFCAGVLSACSASTAQDEGPEPSIQVQPVTSSSQVQLPVARYTRSDAQEKALMTAVNIAQRACGRTYGIDSGIQIVEQQALIRNDSERRYGIVNSDEVQRYGYQPVPQGGGADEKASGWAPSERERAVMNGVDAAGATVDTDTETGKKIPPGGCAAEGFRKLLGKNSGMAFTAVVDDILAESWELTKADSRSLAVAKKWAACMAERGYPGFKSRWDAGNSVASASQSEQIAMATADLACAQKTDYIGTWYAVDVAYQNRLIDEKQGELEAVLAEQRAVDKRVQDTLKTGI